MPSFSASQIMANLLFSSVGFVAFRYGRRMSLVNPMIIGVLLMGYTYFVESTALLFGFGLVLTAALFFFRE